MGMPGRHLPGRAAGCGGAGLPPQAVHRLRAAPVRACQEATAVPLLPQLHRGLRQLPLPGPTLIYPGSWLGDESIALHVGLCHLDVMASNGTLAGEEAAFGALPCAVSALAAFVASQLPCCREEMSDNVSEAGSFLQQLHQGTSPVPLPHH